ASIQDLGPFVLRHVRGALDRHGFARGHERFRGFHIGKRKGFVLSTPNEQNGLTERTECTVARGEVIHRHVLHRRAKGRLAPFIYKLCANLLNRFGELLRRHVILAIVLSKRAITEARHGPITDERHGEPPRDGWSLYRESRRSDDHHLAYS